MMPRCPTCKKWFETENARARHEARAHRRERELRERCEFCGERYRTPKELARHLNKEHRHEEVRRSLPQRLIERERLVPVPVPVPAPLPSRRWPRPWDPWPCPERRRVIWCGPPSDRVQRAGALAASHAPSAR